MSLRLQRAGGAALPGRREALRCALLQPPVIFLARGISKWRWTSEKARKREHLWSGDTPLPNPSPLRGEGTLVVAIRDMEARKGDVLFPMGGAGSFRGVHDFFHTYIKYAVVVSPELNADGLRLHF